mmetsp:Transcript_5681/g.17545  ORF Transcript_5681/g.17545 Transcript_5681/m.17545 type:complete len:324 (+) Transcript_5681:1700-2671(+)
MPRGRQPRRRGARHSQALRPASARRLRPARTSCPPHVPPAGVQKLQRSSSCPASHALQACRPLTPSARLGHRGRPHRAGVAAAWPPQLARQGPCRGQVPALARKRPWRVQQQSSSRQTLLRTFLVAWRAPAPVVGSPSASVSARRTERSSRRPSDWARLQRPAPPGVSAAPCLQLGPAAASTQTLAAPTARRACQPSTSTAAGPQATRAASATAAVAAWPLRPRQGRTPRSRSRQATSATRRRPRRRSPRARPRSSASTRSSRAGCSSRTARGRSWPRPWPARTGRSATSPAACRQRAPRPRAAARRPGARTAELPGSSSSER